MAFKIDDFIDKVASTLAVQGFIETAREIREAISRGYPGDIAESYRFPMRTKDQYVVCADIIERNILLPYAAWEASVIQLAGAEIGSDGVVDFQREWEDLFLVEESGTAPLGSFDYREPIAALATIVGKLRSMDPPPDSDGGTPDKGPAGAGESFLVATDNDQHSKYRRPVRRRPKYDIAVALARVERKDPVSGWEEVLIEPRIPKLEELKRRPNRFQAEPYAVAVRGRRNYE